MGDIGFFVLGERVSAADAGGSGKIKRRVPEFNALDRRGYVAAAKP